MLLSCLLCAAGAGESYRTSFRPGDVPAGAASSSVSASAARPRVLGHRSNAIGRGGVSSLGIVVILCCHDGPWPIRHNEL